MLERQMAPLPLHNWEARQIAMMGSDQASQIIQQTLAPLDAPFASTNRPGFFWALSPGRIDLFDFAAENVSPTKPAGTPKLRETIPLYSTNADTNTGTVDLNAKNSEGRQPIWQGGPPMPVAWVNVLKNPADPVASATNPIVGRFAFWVDDEGAKINVNTADGTYNYQTNSYGQGTPSAVSFSVFREAGDLAAPDTNASRIIAQSGRDVPYASLADVGSRPAQTTYAPFFATNSFNFTTYNRAPDFNLFNEPKFQLFPSNWEIASPKDNAHGTNTVRNLYVQWPYPTKGDGSSPMANGLSRYDNNANVFVVRSVYPTTNQFTNSLRQSVTRPAFLPGYPQIYFKGYLATNYVGSLVASTAKYTAAGGNFANYEQRIFDATWNIAGYLIGRDPFGNQIRWPFQDPAYYLTNNPSASKYNLRQIDSIALQALDLGKQAAHGLGTTWRPPSIAPYGILNPNPNDPSALGQPVAGVQGRFPHLTQVIAKFDYDNSQPAVEPQPAPEDLEKYGNIQGFVRVQSYYPRNIYQPWIGNDWMSIRQEGWTGGLFGAKGMFGKDSFNQEDRIGGRSLLDYHKPSDEKWSYWGDRLLSAKTDSSDPIYRESGIDFLGRHRKDVDLDYRATTNLFQPAADGKIMGRVPNSSGEFSDRGFYVLKNSDAAGSLGGDAPLGIFQTQSTYNFATYVINNKTNGYPVSYLTRNRGPAISQLIFVGGLTYRMFEMNASGGVLISEIVPLDAVSWPLTGSSTNITSQVRTYGPPNYPLLPTNHTVIPFHPPGQPIIVDTNGHEIKYVVSKVRDPILNQLPGDWVPKVFDTTVPNTNQTKIRKYFLNKPSNDGNGYHPYNWDPEEEWVDMASMSGAYTQGSSKGGPTNTWRNTSPQQTLPSVGHLQYLRTGAMPDNPDAVAGDLDYAGMPFRCLNFGPSNTQGPIPDWALLDLFTVPNAVWTKPASKLAYGPGETPRLINLTYGGASTGKINLNGSVLFPWAETNATYLRPMPLAAQFAGLRYNRDGKVNIQMTGAGSAPYLDGPQLNPPTVNILTNSWQVLDGPQAVALAEAVATYIRTKGPFSLPGQICDVPAINACGAEIPTQKTINNTNVNLLPPGVTRFYGRNVPNPETPVINRTRNDIVSQSIGNLVTQGNVLSIWTVGQVIEKGKGNSSYGKVESGDRIKGEVRLHIFLERQLNLGEDGVPGNAANPGPDGAVGSLDDPADDYYNPRNPRFVYRVLGVYEIQ